MGNFYVNFTVRGADQAQVIEVLRAAKRRALVLPPSGGDIVLVDEADTNGAPEVGIALSKATTGVVLEVLNHDDDILQYWLYRGGELIDEYDSTPDYFADMMPPDVQATLKQGGNAALLCEAMGRPQATAHIETILRDDEYTFAIDRHGALTKALGLPDSALGASYEYWERGDWPDGVDESEIVHIE